MSPHTRQQVCFCKHSKPNQSTGAVPFWFQATGDRAQIELPKCCMLRGSEQGEVRLFTYVGHLVPVPQQPQSLKPPSTVNGSWERLFRGSVMGRRQEPAQPKPTQNQNNPMKNTEVARRAERRTSRSQGKCLGRVKRIGCALCGCHR